MPHRNSTRAFAVLLVSLFASPAAAQLLTDLNAFAVSQGYPSVGGGPTASDPVTLMVIGKGCPTVDRLTRNGDTFDVRLVVDTLPPGLPVPCSTFARPFFVDRLPAGTYHVRVFDGESLGYQGSFLVRPPETQLVLNGSELAFELEYKLPGSPAKRKAFAAPLAAGAGYFWFFTPDGPEVQLRVIDARAFDGHRWLFVSSSTTLEFDLIAKGCPPVDPLLCFEFKRYHQIAGRARPIFDVAFD